MSCGRLLKLLNVCPQHTRVRTGMGMRVCACGCLLCVIRVFLVRICACVPVGLCVKGLSDGFMCACACVRAVMLWQYYALILLTSRLAWPPCCSRNLMHPCHHALMHPCHHPWPHAWMATRLHLLCPQLRSHAAALCVHSTTPLANTSHSTPQTPLSAHSAPRAPSRSRSAAGCFPASHATHAQRAARAALCTTRVIAVLPCHWRY